MSGNFGMSGSETVDVQRSLGRLEGKIDLILQNMQAHLIEDTARFDKINTRQDKTDARHNTLERKWWLATGVGVAAIFVLQNIDHLFNILTKFKL